MNYQNKDNSFGIPKSVRWVICSLCMLAIVILIYRVISTGTPKEFQNYIIKNPKIDEMYKELQDNFTIYQINQNNAFALDGALFIENVYYFEEAENLQINIRFKNNSIQPLLINPESPFKAWLKVLTKYDDAEWWSADENKIVGTGWGDISSEEKIFGKSTDKYQYAVYSFDEVVIDYTNSKVELYLFINNMDGEIDINENDALARFVIFDGILRDGITTPISRVQSKNLKLG